MSVSLKALPVVAAAAAPIRVMVVDDAAVVRGLLTRWIDEEPGLTMVASLRSGRQAIEELDRAAPDVVILDVDMPDLDGLAALPLLLERRPDLIVIMASTLTRRNAEIGLKALSLGATDCLPKPESSRDIAAGATFRRELIEKIRELGRRRSRPTPRFQARTPAALVHSPRREPTASSTRFGLRPFSTVRPRALVIGASTGGPQALNALVARLGSVLDRAPVLVTQHMPRVFTAILAEHLARASGRPAREARDGEPVEAGTIYLAPGGRHMRVAQRAAGAVIALDDTPPVKFCRPAVDPLFSSAATLWGDAVLGVVLTGMGTDGSDGAIAIAAAGGSVIAQDEATSVIWGMPHAAARTGACAAILPLEDIAPKVVRLFRGERS